MPSLEQLRRQRRLAEESANKESNQSPGVTETVSGSDENVNHKPKTVADAALSPEDESAVRSVASVAQPELQESHGADSGVDVPAETPVMSSDEEPSGHEVSDKDIQAETESASVAEVPVTSAQESVPDGIPVVSLEPAAASDSTDNDAGKPVKKKTGSGKRVGRRGRKSVPDDFKADGTIRVDLPAKLVTMARGQFPDANNNTEAVAAWMYAKSDKVADVPDSVKQLAATYTGDQMSNLVKDVSERLAVLDSRTIKMQMLTDGRLQEMWYMVAYLMLERMDALAKTHMKDLDLTLPVFESLRADVNAQFRKVRNRQQLQDGRQIYQRKVNKDKDA